MPCNITSQGVCRASELVPFDVPAKTLVRTQKQVGEVVSNTWRIETRTDAQRNSGSLVGMSRGTKSRRIKARAMASLASSPFGSAAKTLGEDMLGLPIPYPPQTRNRPDGLGHA